MHCVKARIGMGIGTDRQTKPVEWGKTRCEGASFIPRPMIVGGWDKGMYSAFLY